jgi:hypothetical protein
MCGAGNGASSGGKSGGNNNNKPAKTPVRARNNKQKKPVKAVAPSPNEQGQKPVTRLTVPVNRNKPAKAVKPFDTAGYNTRAAANKNTNIPILSTIIKDKYRNDEVSYNQAYWATQRASGVDTKAEMDSIGMKKAYSGDRVPTRFPNTGPPSQNFREGTTSVNSPKAKAPNRIALTTEASEGGSSGGANQATASSSGTAGATGQAANLRNMLASKTKKKRLGLRQLKNSSVGVSGGSGYNGLNIIS